MKVIDDRQNLIADKKKELVKEITHMVVKITNTVNMRGKHLVLRLNEVSGNLFFYMYEFYILHTCFKQELYIDDWRLYNKKHKPQIMRGLFVKMVIFFNFYSWAQTLL